MILQVLRKEVRTLNTCVEEHRAMSEIAGSESVCPSSCSLGASHFSVLETLDRITATMTVEVGRYFLGIIDRADNGTSVITARTVSSELGDILSHLIDVLQVTEEEVTYQFATIIQFASFALHVLLVFLGPVLHVLDLNPTSLTAVLHELLEISLNLVRSIKCSVTILGEQSQACRTAEILQADIRCTLIQSQLRIVLCPECPVSCSFLRCDVA